jgi:hypothetical protein
MNSGYSNKYLSKATCNQKTKEYAILRKGTPEEQEELKRLWTEARELAGQDWYRYSIQKTTDEGTEKAAILLAKYRSLLSNISHREEQVKRLKENG